MKKKLYILFILLTLSLLAEIGYKHLYPQIIFYLNKTKMRPLILDCELAKFNIGIENIKNIKSFKNGSKSNHLLVSLNQCLSLELLKNYLISHNLHINYINVFIKNTIINSNLPYKVKLLVLTK